MTDEQKASIEYAAGWLSRSEDIGNRKHADRLRALLAASAPNPSAEPVAWYRQTDITELTDSEPETDGWTPLYAAPIATPSDKQEAVAFENWIESVPPLTWESWGRREAAHAAWLAAPLAQSAEQDRIDAERWRMAILYEYVTEFEVLGIDQRIAIDKGASK